MTSFFKSPAKIRYDIPADAKALLIIVHGMAEHSERYREVIEYFNAHKIGCVSYDQRGHGRAVASESERGDVHSFDDFVLDVAASVDTVRGLHPQLPIFLWGHSMGAIIVSLAIAQITALAPRKVRGVITSSAPIASFDSISSLVLRGLKLLARVLPQLRLSRPVDPGRLSRNLEVGVRYAQDPLVPKATTLRLLVQLQLATERCLRAVRKVRTPWLLLHGTADQVAPPIGSQRLMDAIGSDDKQIRLFPDARHEVHNEIEPTRTEFLQCMEDWIEARL